MKAFLKGNDQFMEQKYLSRMDLKEQDRHHYYAENAKVGIVEIGVLNGETSKIFCKANKITPITGIDPIIPDSMNSDLIGNIQKIKEIEVNHSNYRFINDFSFNVIKTWNQKIDYLFIDGDHTYDAVKNDFESWFPFVVCGGIIALHDSACNRGGPHFWPGPSQLADELLTDNRLKYLETVYTMTIFKKDNQ